MEVRQSGANPSTFLPLWEHRHADVIQHYNCLCFLHSRAHHSCDAVSYDNGVNHDLFRLGRFPDHVSLGWATNRGIW